MSIHQQFREKLLADWDNIPPGPLNPTDKLYRHIIGAFILPLAAEIDRQKQVIDNLQNRLNAPPTVQRTVISHTDDIAHCL